MLADSFVPASIEHSSYCCSCTCDNCWLQLLLLLVVLLLFAAVLVDRRPQQNGHGTMKMA